MTIALTVILIETTGDISLTVPFMVRPSSHLPDLLYTSRVRPYRVLRPGHPWSVRLAYRCATNLTGAIDLSIV